MAAVAHRAPEAPSSNPAAADLSGLARKGSLSLIGGGVSALCNLLLVVVIARGVGRAEAGIFFTATSLFLLVESLSLLGTTTGLVFFIARLRALGEPQRARECLRAALVPVVALATVAGLLMLLAAPWLADQLLPGDRGVLVPCLRVLGVALPVAAVYDAITAASRGFHDVRPSVYVEKVGRSGGQVLLVATVLLAGGSLTVLTAAWAVPYAAGLAVLGFWLARLLARDTAARHPSGRHAAEAPLRPEFWRYTLPRSLAAVAQMALQRLDIVLVGAFLGAADAAVYTAATRFLVVGQLANQSISLAVQPKLSELISREQLSEARLVYQASTGWLVLVTWPLYLLCAVGAPVLLELFGAGYSGGESVVVILSLTMLLATGTGMVDLMLMMAGRTSWNLMNVAVAFAVNLVADLILIPTVGIEGAAIAWAAAIVVNNLLPLVQVHRLLRAHPFGPGTVRAFVLAVGCYGVVPLVLRWVIGDAGIGLGAGIVVGSAGYAIGLRRYRRSLELSALFVSLRSRSRRSRPMANSTGSHGP
ncbi:MAG TPA: oligosaccharide flippase family protein [Mycobacteriales bacterium]|nr:oligosaccharide flippase family protein [Mycobacteriales bacterium]